MPMIDVLSPCRRSAIHPPMCLFLLLKMMVARDEALWVQLPSVLLLFQALQCIGMAAYIGRAAINAAMNVADAAILGVQADNIPLVVDVDGTLIKPDLLYELTRLREQPP